MLLHMWSPDRLRLLLVVFFSGSLRKIQSWVPVEAVNVCLGDSFRLLRCIEDTAGAPPPLGPKHHVRVGELFFSYLDSFWQISELCQEGARKQVKATLQTSIPTGL